MLKLFLSLSILSFSLCCHSIPTKHHILKQEILVDHTKISKKYKIKPEIAKEYVDLAKKYEKRDFPTAKDILAVVSVESSFKSYAKSKLKRDPAIGLMQVRPKVWKLNKNDLSTPDKQIKVGSDILHSYYKKLGNKEDALHAYNVGITNFKKKKNLNPKYQQKVAKAYETL